MSLNALLKELDINVEEEDETVDLSNVKLEDIPEEQRPIFEKALKIIGDQTNTIAENNIIMQTMKESMKTDPKPEEKPEEKGDDDDDPYKKRFEALENQIKNIGVKTPEMIHEDFKKDMQKLHENDRDMVQFIPEMQAIVKMHPTMKQDVPNLYKLARQTKERRENEKAIETERAGTNTGEVHIPIESKSIGDAFAAAETQLTK